MKIFNYIVKGNKENSYMNITKLDEDILLEVSYTSNKTLLERLKLAITILFKKTNSVTDVTFALESQDKRVLKEIVLDAK